MKTHIHTFAGLSPLGVEGNLRVICREKQLIRRYEMNRLPIRVGNRYIFIRLEDVDAFEVEGNYLRIYTGESSHLLRGTLSSIEEQLDGQRFLRINRSTIINLEKLKELKILKYSNYEAVLFSGKSWLWGRKFRENLKRVVQMGEQIC